MKFYEKVGKDMRRRSDFDCFSILVNLEEMHETNVKHMKRN